jgi:hypothetical protein
VSKYPDLFDRLAENRPGEPTWTTEDLEKLAGLNLLRVLGEVEKVSSLLIECLDTLFLFYSWWDKIRSLGIPVSNEPNIDTSVLLINGNGTGGRR